MLRIYRQIFDYDWAGNSVQAIMSVSILEIYNDKLKDLLVTSVGPGYLPVVVFFPRLDLSRSSLDMSLHF